MRPNYAAANVGHGMEMSYPSGSPHDLEYVAQSQDEFDQRGLNMQLERKEEMQRAELRARMEDI